jgi:hypothetical protein
MVTSGGGKDGRNEECENRVFAAIYTPVSSGNLSHLQTRPCAMRMHLCFTPQNIACDCLIKNQTLLLLFIKMARQTDTFN